MKRDTRNIIIVLILVFALGLGVRVAIKLDEEGAFVNTPLYDKSILTIRVESTHYLLSANYELFLGEDKIESWSMGPGQYYEVIYQYSTLITEPNEYLVIKVISAGGGFGTQSDAYTVLVGTGIDYSVTLRA